MSHKRPNFCGRTRREFIWQTGGGFGAAALGSMLGQDGFFTEASGSDAVSLNPLAPKPPHFAPKAKSVIFLFMYGGPSHIDTFDYKPSMNGMDGKTVEEEFDNLWATCVQHEIDHLNGTLFIDYLKPLKRQMITRKMQKLKRELARG